MAACFIDVGRVAIFQKGHIMEGDNQTPATPATPAETTPAAENTTAAPVTVTETPAPAPSEGDTLAEVLAELKAQSVLLDTLAEKYDGQQKAIAKIVQHLGDMRISGVSIEVPAALTELLGG